MQLQREQENQDLIQKIEENKDTITRGYYDLYQEKIK